MNRYQEKIINDTETRLRTIMIGSLSRIENTFGHLWNHGSDPTSSSQEKFAQQWEDLRLEILNHGNNQIRLAINDLYRFFDNVNKYDYNYNFIMKPKDRR